MVYFIVIVDVNVKIIIGAGVADVVVVVEVALEVVIAKAMEVIVVICVWGWELENKNIWIWVWIEEYRWKQLFWLEWVCPSLLLICGFRWNWCNHIFFEIKLDKIEVSEFFMNSTF